MSYSPDAQRLNKILEEKCPVAFRALSPRGKRLFMPMGGILKQAAEAKGKEFNATIGIALDDEGQPLSTASLIAQVPSIKSLPYAPGSGVPELRSIWQDQILKKNPSLNEKHITTPIVTSGLTHGLTVVGQLFLDKDETLITTDQYWGNYNLIFKVNQEVNIDTFSTFKGKHFDTQALEKKLAETSGKKVVLFNFPNNPTGYSPNKNEAKKIVDILTKAAQNDDIVVILDDAYFGLFFEEDINRESLFALLANAHENLLAIKLDGATKEDFAWGLRVGFITIGHPSMNKEIATALEQKITGTIRSQISMPAHPSQVALINAMNTPKYEGEKKQNAILLQKRYDEVRRVLDKNKEKYSQYFTPLPFNSGYFMCVELIDTLEAEEMRKILLDQYSTGVISTGNKLRVAFSCVSVSQIGDLFKNIYNACDRASQ